jgi:hypothetical protein
VARVVRVPRGLDYACASHTPNMLSHEISMVMHVQLVHRVWGIVESMSMDVGLELPGIHHLTDAGSFSSILEARNNIVMRCNAMNAMHANQIRVHNHIIMRFLDVTHAWE